MKQVGVQSGSFPTQPAGLIELKRVNWVVPAVPLHVKGEEVAGRTRRGRTAPLRSSKCDPLHSQVLFGQRNFLEVA